MMVCPTAGGTPMWRSAQLRICGPSLSRKNRLSAVNDRKIANEPSTFTPVPTPCTSAWKAPLRLLLAASFASLASLALTPASLSVVSSFPAAPVSVLSRPAAWPATPPMIRTVNPMPTAMIATKTSAAAAARGSPRRCSRPTSGESTAATIDAVTTGATIALVRESRAAIPTSSAATPTSSQDIIPRSRSHLGAANTPPSSPGANSTNSAGGSPLALAVGR